MTTIGVSVSIPQPWGDFLQRQREDFGDPLASAVPAHVTLMPPTDVSESLRPLFEEHLERVASAHAPFEMVLRGTGTFRPTSPVVFVQVAKGIPSCERLESHVRSGPVPRPLEFNYHPHVTVAHAVSEEALDSAFNRLADFEAAFVVDAVHLYEHGDDGVWRPCRRFALVGAAAG